MPCPSLQQCQGAGGNLVSLCQEIVRVCEKDEDIQTQIYIISGAVGGVLLILIILIIALFVKLHNSSNQADGLRGATGDELSKRGFSTYTGPYVSPKNTAPPAPAPFIPATGAALGYDNTTYDPRSTNAINNSGGVRVLPRNPPPARTNQASYNEGYY